jgi:hypothetical protein
MGIAAQLLLIRRQIGSNGKDLFAQNSHTSAEENRGTLAWIRSMQNGCFLWGGYIDIFQDI